MDPIRELPYWPAAMALLIEAGQMTASDYVPTCPKLLLASEGASTDAIYSGEALTKGLLRLADQEDARQIALQASIEATFAWKDNMGLKVFASDTTTLLQFARLALFAPYAQYISNEF